MYGWKIHACYILFSHLSLILTRISLCLNSLLHLTLCTLGLPQIVSVSTPLKLNIFYLVLLNNAPRSSPLHCLSVVTLFRQLMKFVISVSPLMLICLSKLIFLLYVAPVFITSVKYASLDPLLIQTLP